MPKYQITPKYQVTNQNTIIAVRQVQNRGRVQIPPEILENLQIRYGDKIFWIRTLDGKYAIIKSVKI